MLDGNAAPKMGFVIGFVYSTKNEASRNMGEYLLREHGFQELSESIFRSGNIALYRIDSELVYYNTIENADLELVCFLSSHSSAQGIGAFTVHPLGNWSGENRLGGEPMKLSVAAPGAMFSVLSGLDRIESSLTKTYEATHHGPLLRRPSLFVELGGNDHVRADRMLAGKVAEAAYNAVENDPEYRKVVVGIGSMHYPAKFTRLALLKGYAFGHILPKYAIMNADGSSNISMLEQACSESSEQPEAAVIEWKSMNAAMRSIVIRKLDEMGLEYEKV